MGYGTKLEDLRGQRRIEDVAMETGLDRGTIHKIEYESSCPKLDTVIKLLKIYKPTAEQVMDLLELEGQMNTDAAYNRTESHKKLLQVFEGQAYHCCFMSNSGSEKFECLSTDAFSYHIDGYSYSKALLGGNTYDCKIVVAPTASFTFMSFSSSDKLADKAYFIIPYDTAVKNYFDVGLGSMVSLARKGSHRQIPSFQLVAVISDRYSKELGGIDEFQKICGERLKLPQIQNDGYTLQVEGIHDLSYKLYEEVENIVKQKKLYPKN